MSYEWRDSMNGYRAVREAVDAFITKRQEITGRYVAKRAAEVLKFLDAVARDPSNFDLTKCDRKFFYLHRPISGTRIGDALNSVYYALRGVGRDAWIEDYVLLDSNGAEYVVKWRIVDIAGSTEIDSDLYYALRAILLTGDVEKAYIFYEENGVGP